MRHALSHLLQNCLTFKIALQAGKWAVCIGHTRNWVGGCQGCLRLASIRYACQLERADWSGTQGFL